MMAACPGLLYKGVPLLNHQVFIGATRHRVLGCYTLLLPEGRVLLQDYGTAVRYRDTWIRRTGNYGDP